MQAPPYFARTLCRISGVVFALMGLAWIPGLAIGAYRLNAKQFLFNAAGASIFFFFSWLYLKGPMSRYGQRENGQSTWH